MQHDTAQSKASAAAGRHAPASSHQLQATHALRRLRIRLAAALCVIALVTLSALLLAWMQLASAPLHAQTINLVGRQRMLATRVLDGVAHLASSATDARARRDLAESLHELLRVHRLLGLSDSDIALSPEMRAHWQRAGAPLAIIRATTEHVLQPTAAAGGAAVQLGPLRGAVRTWVDEIDALNTRIVSERARRDRWFLQLPLVLGILIVLTLAFTWRVLHEPALRLMSGTLDDLERERMLRTRQAERQGVAMQAAAMGIWEWNAQTGALEYDGFQQELFGTDPSRWRERVFPDDLPAVDASLQRAFNGDGDYLAQFRVRREDGEVRWLQGNSVLVRSDDGAPLRLVGVNLDITARQHAEAQRRELDLRLQMLSDNLPGALCQFRVRADGSSCFPYASAGLETLTGLAPADLVHDSERFFAAIHADDAARIQTTIRDSARTLGVFNQDFRILHTAGDVRWVRAHATPQREADGATTWFGVLLDSSVIKESERREREATASLEAAQALVRLGSWSYDVKTHAVAWSRQMYVLFDRDPALGPPSHTGARSVNYVAEDADWLTKAMKAAIEEGIPYSGTLRLLHPRPGITTLRAEGQVTLDATGRTTSVFGTVMDITMNVEREAALQQAHLAAEAANRAKSEFLANMSHEIRTPMAAILGYVDLLAENELPNPQLREFVSTIQRNAKHLLELVNQVLDLSKIEAGEMTIERIKCSPAALMRETLSLLRPRAREKNLTLSLRFEGPVPLSIRSDPTRLRQIMLNLVGNAIKFTQTGGVEVLVRVQQPRAPEPLLMLQVKDTGIGIEAAQLGKLFRPFSQADSSTTRRFGGTGLGLSIAKHLVELLGGQIHVISTPGRGATFTASVATGDLTGVEFKTFAVEVDSRPVTPLPPRVSSLAPLTGLLVVLVEDGIDNQRLISLHLTKAGAQVEVIANGQLAVERLTAQDKPRCDVVLMDMQMPVLDGYEATRALRAARYTGKIIALTAHAMEGDRKRCLQAGCDDYATKPVNREQIIATILAHTKLLPSLSSSPANSQHALISTLEDDPELSDIIGEFIAALPKHAAALEVALVARDHDSMSKIAHQLRGAGGGYGFQQITEAAARVENELAAGREGRQLDEHVGLLVALCRAARSSERPRLLGS